MKHLPKNCQVTENEKKETWEKRAPIHAKVIPETEMVGPLQLQKILLVKKKMEFQCYQTGVRKSQASAARFDKIRIPFCFKSLEDS